MDVASTMAVSVAPPSFSKEAEEARRDTQNRVSIPKATESANSAAQSHIGDNRGNTDGENSLLNAQQRGIADARDNLSVTERKSRRRRKKEAKLRREKSTEKALQQAKDSLLNVDGVTSDENLNDEQEEEKGGFDVETGYYIIPAYRHQKRREILLKFKEKNVHFLEQFSDVSTTVGLINFALNRHYGRIIPHSRRGQVVEKMA